MQRQGAVAVAQANGLGVRGEQRAEQPRRCVALDGDVQRQRRGVAVADRARLGPGPQEAEHGLVGRRVLECQVQRQQAFAVGLSHAVGVGLEQRLEHLERRPRGDGHVQRQRAV